MVTQGKRKQPSAESLDCLAVSCLAGSAPGARAWASQLQRKNFPPTSHTFTSGQLATRGSKLKGE